MAQVMSIIPKLLGVAGTGANIFNSIQQAQSQSLALQQQKRLTELAKDPQKLAAAIKSLQQPLSQGLVSDVTNSTQGELASRGLAESPAIFGAQLGQALSPYELKEQELAQNALFSSLGLPPSAQGTPAAPVDTSGFWSRFLPQSTPGIVPVDNTGGSIIPTSSSPDPSSAVSGVWPGFLDDASFGGF